MPHVDLPGTGVSLYYELHTATGRPDPAKPSLILVAPSWGNILQLKDYIAAFKNDYSVCCIEPRSHGRTRNAVTASFDHFVAAADLAFAMEALQLPPSHIFAAGVQAFQPALKMSILFPDHVLSLSLVGLSSMYALPRHIKEFREVGEAWTAPEDESIWAECVEAIGQFVLTESEGREKVWDTVLPSLVRHYNPYKASNVWMSTAPNQTVSKITPELLADIKQPLLLIQGEADMCYPAEDVEALAEHFTGSRDVRFRIEPGAPHLLALTHAPSVIPRMRDFLSAHSADPPAVIPLDARRALERAARITGNADVVSRDPSTSNSFCLLKPDELAAGKVRLQAALAQEKECRLNLPMCFEKDDWEEGADQQRRWTWTGRVEYARRHEAARPISTTSFGSGIAVEVQQQSEVTCSPGSPMTSATASMRTTTLNCDDDDDVPPPLPSKPIRV
ncbi:hypothetical protein JCM9279_006609 [Rhodotorula babjevae]